MHHNNTSSSYRGSKGFDATNSILKKFPKPTLNNTTVRTLGGGPPIDVYPPEVYFNNIQLHQNYEVTVEVKNISKKVRRVKFQQPRTNKFRCDYNMHGPVAAGLAIKLNVSFETETEGDFHDTIRISTEENYVFELKVHALKAAPTIIFQPLLNFGFISVGREHRDIIQFVNQGKLGGKISLRQQTGGDAPPVYPDLKFDPQNFSILPNQRKLIKVSLTGWDPQFLRRLIDVHISPMVTQASIMTSGPIVGEKIKHLDVNATVVEQNISIVFQDGGGQASDIDFGSLYFGERKECAAYLVNNGPEQVMFNFDFFQGKKSLGGEGGMDQSSMAQNQESKSIAVNDEDIIAPSQLGQQLADRVMLTEPLSGKIPSYSQIPIRLICRTKPQIRQKGFSDFVGQQNKEGDQFDKQDLTGGDSKISKGDEGGVSQMEPAFADYEYTAIASFPNIASEQRLTIFMKAKGVSPNIRISRTVFQFGECSTLERKDAILHVENLNQNMPLDFSFSKVAHFSATPSRGRLMPATQHSITLSFQPKNLGAFNSFMYLDVLRGSNKFQINVMGQASSLGKRDNKLRGPTSKAQDFYIQRNYVASEKLDEPMPSKKAKKIAAGLVKAVGAGDLPRWLQETTLMAEEGGASIGQSQELTQKLDQVMVIRENKEIFNKFLTQSRKIRQNNEKTNKIIKSTLTGKIPKTLEQIQEDLDLGLDPHYDKRVPEPKLQQPQTNQPLYVQKPIGPYEPPSGFAARGSQKFDQHASVKKRFKQHPKNQAEMRECGMELDSNQLQKIGAGPKNINFGDSVFVKSTATRYFSVINNIRQNIIVSLDAGGASELSFSPPSQVIPPAQTASFGVVFCSLKPQSFRGFVTYTINGRHSFKFFVAANAEPVMLELSKSTLVFSFPEQSVEMQCKTSFMVSNNGNANARFALQLPQPSFPFKPNPSDATVAAGSSKIIQVLYHPSGQRKDEGNLSMKIQDGVTIPIKCIGQVPEAKCKFVEKSIDFGCVPVGIRTNEQALHVQNLMRAASIFKIQNPCKELTLNPMIGKIPPQGKLTLKMSYLSAKDEQDLEFDLSVLIRGGKPVKVPIRVKSVIPRVQVVEDKFEFGGVTFGDSKILPFTLLNQSDIDAKVVLDLREQPQFELKAMAPSQTTKPQASPDLKLDEASIMAIDLDPQIVQPMVDPIQAGIGGIQDLNNLGPEDIDEAADQDDEGSDLQSEGGDDTRYVQITVKRGEVLKLCLKYTPCDVDSLRDFKLPLSLAGLGQLDSLTRTVKGVGLRPRFLFDPPYVDFKKKVIAKGSKPFPANIDLAISNPDSEPIEWSIDKVEIQKFKGVFSLHPADGRLQPGVTSNVRASFNPIEAKEYYGKIPLYLDNDKSKPYLFVEFKGEGTVPRLTFDRREIVLPIVPLGLPAKSQFVVYNQGYQNLELRPRVVSEVGKLPVTISFPDGSNVGVTKPKVKVEATFVHKKPLSFTTRVEFQDDEGNLFSIPICGTTDNSLLTNFSYIERNPDEVTIEFEEGRPIMLVEDASSDHQNSTNRNAMGGTMSKMGTVSRTGASSVISRTAKSLMGFTPINIYILERSAQFLVRWMNTHIPAFSGLHSFPNDIITTCGTQIYELIFHLSGKHAPGRGKAKKGGVLPVAESSMQGQLTQYQELLNYLKVNGAMLNSVRPQYLLSLQDYARFLRQNQDLIQFKPRTLERIFTYISLESWLTLTYQVLKVFYLNRITPKLFKSQQASVMPASDLTVDSTMNNSNLYSTSETILLKWMQWHYNRVNPLHPRKLCNFDRDLQDGHVFAALLVSHYGELDSLRLMKATVYNEEGIQFNSSRLIEGLGEIGLGVCVNAKDFSNCCARDMVLLAVQLFQTLPHYLPKAQIEFPAVLGDTVTKTIELTNPSGGVISYWAKLDGSKDFKIQTDSVTLQSKQTVPFPIRYVSRISAPVTGKILFTNRSDGSTVQAASMVFGLKSNVHSRRSIQVIEKKTPLYEPLIVDLQITNPFSQDVVFSVQLQQGAAIKKEKAQIDTKQKGKARGNKSQQNKSQLAARTSLPGGSLANSPPDPFFCKHDFLRLKKQGTNIIQVTFLPFEMGQHRCFVVLVDENVGEIQYEIIGEAVLPQPTQAIRDKCMSDQMHIVDIQIPFRNLALEKAKTLTLDRAGAAGRDKQKRGGLASKQVTSVNNEKASAGGDGSQSQIDSLSFDVEVKSPYFSGPTTCTLYDPTRGPPPGIEQSRVNRSIDNEDGGGTKPRGGDRSTLGAESYNKVSLNFLPKTPASYFCQVILRSHDGQDIRMFDVHVTAMPQSIKAQLEFIVPARGVISQQIPIVNNSDRDWSIKSILSQNVMGAIERSKEGGMGGDQDLFSLAKMGQFTLNQREIQVKRKSTNQFVLNFKPLWSCQIEGKLTLTNATTNQVYEYDLKGVGEEPLAEDHIILDCKARQTTEYVFEIKNPTDKPQVFKIQTDLNNVTGPQQVKLKPKETAKYPIKITPLLGGTYTGSVTFIDQDDRFIWYTVQVRTQSPVPQKTLELQSIIRKAVAVDIMLENPLQEPVTFEVFFTGGGLLGDSIFSIGPKTSSTYELLYSPLKTTTPGLPEKGTIGFLNEKLGEFWYDLVLTCDESPIHTVPAVECELGKRKEIFVDLENPINDQVIIEHNCSNSTNFEIFPEKILIGPYDQFKVCVQYSPSTLNQLETGQIQFKNEAIGKWKYRVQGRGLYPTIMEPQPVSTAVGTNTSSMLAFKNPFRQPSMVDVQLDTMEQNGIFQLLLKKNRFSIPPLGILQIPYSFSPQSMTQSSAVIIVKMSSQLIWKYPIRGIAQLASTSIDFMFKTKSRETFSKELEVVLPHIEAAQLSHGETFHHQLKVLNEAQEGFIKRTVLMDLPNNKLIGKSLNFFLRFEPLRPFKANCELLVYKSSGGRWKFNCIFQASEPQVDDVINLKSPLHKTSSVSFKLTNHLRAPAEFEAHMTAESASEFMVYPTSGVLPPFGKEGTSFIVSFTPIEYGKPKVAKLVITTDEMQWSYQLRGSHPHYKIPDIGAGRLNNKLPINIIEVMQKKQQEKKNFMKANMISAANQSPGKNSVLGGLQAGGGGSQSVLSFGPGGK